MDPEVPRDARGRQGDGGRDGAKGRRFSRSTLQQKKEKIVMAKVKKMRMSEYLLLKALRYAGHGWRVFPLHSIREGRELRVMRP